MNLTSFVMPAGMALLLFSSCQKEEGVNPALQFRSHDCASLCIDADAPVYHEESGFVRESTGSSNFRQFDYTVYNTLEGFELAWAYSASSSTPRRLTFTVSGAGFTSSLAYTTPCEKAPLSGTHSFPFTGSWSGCDNVSFTASLEDCGGIQKAANSGTYALVGACGCDEDFHYTDNQNETYTFSYTPEEDLNDAHLIFTFAQGVVVTGLTGWASNGVTRQNHEDLEACTTYNWTVGLTCADNPGAHNLWTDFKVNNESKKNGLTPNIVADCE